MKISVHRKKLIVFLFCLIVILLTDIPFSLFAKNNLQAFLIIQGVYIGIMILLLCFAIKQKTFSVVCIDEQKIQLKHFGATLQSYLLQNVYIQFAILFTRGGRNVPTTYEPCLVFSENKPDRYVYKQNALSKKSTHFLLIPTQKDLEKLLSQVSRPIDLPTWITIEDYLITIHDNLTAFDTIETFYRFIEKNNAQRSL